MTQVAKTPPTNGAAKTTVLVAVPQEPQAGKKIEKPAPSKNPDDLPPLDERLHRLNQLFNIQTKYNKYTESLHKLNEFEIKKDGERSSIRIADDSRNDFSTYHPEIVQEVVDFLKVRIKEKIKAIEPQLKW